MKTVLELEFEDQYGKSFKLRVPEPKEDLEELQISSAMDIIIENDVFVSNNTQLVRAISARVIKTTIETMEFV